VVAEVPLDLRADTTRRFAMNDIAVPQLGIVRHRFGAWARIAVLAFAFLALAALSFALGRVTMGHTGASTTGRPALVQLHDSPGYVPADCRPHAPC
jgi:hypothetical protein